MREKTASGRVSVTFMIWFLQTRQLIFVEPGRTDNIDKKQSAHKEWPCNAPSMMGVQVVNTIADFLEQAPHT
jgi:hypothetical protein